MDRRELLKLLPIAAITPAISKPGMAGYELSKGKFLIFVDTRAIELDSLTSDDGFSLDALVVPVYLRHDQSMSDVLAIFNVDENSIDAEIKEPQPNGEARP